METVDLFPSLEKETIETAATKPDKKPTSSDFKPSDVPDDRSIASEDPEMETFKDYKPKIEELLRQETEFAGYVVSELQHGSGYQNCVYGLTSPKNPQDQYVLRVPVLPELDDDGTCEDVDNDVMLLRFLHGKLPVPEIKQWYPKQDNVLGKPYMIQTRIPGVSLNNIYDELSYEEKSAIVEQYVELLAKVESIKFSVAGTFSRSPDHCQGGSSDPPITIFNEGDEEFMRNPGVVHDRAGPDLKVLLVSHINGWIRKESRKAKSFTLKSLKFLLTMVDDLDYEGAFQSAPYPIVLHHWDLEPRNIMVEKIDNTWKIQGIIDWDAAVALPRPLARRAPDWIWDFDSEGFTGYVDNDHHPKPELQMSAYDRLLKAHFDALAAENLEGYLEDAYEQGLWLRRIWTFARSGVESVWFIDLIKELEVDWKAKQKAQCSPRRNPDGPLKKARTWVRRFEKMLRKWL